MVWQDYVISFVALIFAIALLPQVYDGFKHKKSGVLISTSLMTSAGLYISAATFGTLGLYFSMVMNIVTGTLWFLLFVQKIMYK